MNILEYLKGKCKWAEEDAIKCVLYDRGVFEDAELNETTEQQRDLCYADIIGILLLSPSARGTVSDSDGGWKHQDAGWELSVTDKRILANKARGIYLKYGEEVKDYGVYETKVRRI